VPKGAAEVRVLPSQLAIGIESILDTPPSALSPCIRNVDAVILTGWTLGGHLNRRAVLRVEEARAQDNAQLNKSGSTTQLTINANTHR